MAADAELAAEQVYVDHAYACLAGMRARAAELVGHSEDLDLEAALARRVALLQESPRPLCFGRIDHVGGERWYIGRRHVEDDASDPVVVEWRAPVAEPFYRATSAEPLELAKRRQYVADGRQLVSMAEDLFDGTGVRQGEPRVRGREALLAELDRSRGGEMVDIVATIQAEQDRVIRSPRDGVLVVQGGPGTGKTAIGLHRVAFLLYADPALARSGVLVVGPSRTFLRYIASVLPSLGEEAVVQVTLEDLVPEIEVGGADRPLVERVKGKAAMAEVLARTLRAMRRPSDGPLEVRVGASTVVVEVGELSEMTQSVARRRLPYSEGRTVLRDLLVRRVYEEISSKVGGVGRPEMADVASQVRRTPAFRATLDRLWPSVSPKTLVRHLLKSPGRLRAVASDLLSREEIDGLEAARRRGSSGRWTTADLALVDEARHLIAGTGFSYGHVVVDEAQDLSPMQLRMLARRCPTGSLTVLGDLARGTGVWARDTWEDVLSDLGWSERGRVVELELGYRAPAQVLELASPLLAEAAPGVRPTESVRRGRTDPEVVRVRAGSLGDAAAQEARMLAGTFSSVAVIGAEDGLASLAGALRRDGSIDFGEAPGEGLGHAVTLVSAPDARGLEFDAVVLVEPAEIAGREIHGLRCLYVAMTRPVQHLSIVHAQELPRLLDVAVAEAAQGSRSTPG